MKTKLIEIEVVQNGLIVRAYPGRPNYGCVGNIETPVYVFNDVFDLQKQLPELLNHER